MSKIEILKEKQFKEAEERFLLAIESGLVYAGRDNEGEHEYIGTKEQWAEYEKKLTNAGL